MIEKLVEIFGWLRNFISPVLIAIIISVVVYFSMKSTFGLIISSFILIFGILIGIYFAEKVRKNIGTDKFNAQVMATPDIKGLEKNKNNTKK